MAGKATYSAGTAFITVVPSFLGIDEAFKKQVRDMAAAADKDLAAGMAKGFTEVNKKAKASGLKSGEDWAGAYEAEVRKRLTAAAKALPEYDPDVKLNKWRKALASVREDMIDLSKQRIGIDIDRKGFEAAFVAIRDELQRLQESAKGGTKALKFFDTDEADKELRALDEFIVRAQQVADRGGESVGNAFTSKFGPAVEKARDALGDLKLGIDPSEAEATLADVGSRLESLRGKTIGVDIDAGAAFAEVKALHTELNSLDRDDVDIEVRTNARAAAGELVAVITAAEGASQATQSIGGSANFSLSRLEYLIALGASLGTVIVPAAAAAAAAIGTIGTLAIGAGAGIGVFALAVSGVSAAVKALNNYENDQAKSAKSVSDANRSVASSTDQVRSAQMALANTRRNIAEAAEDAARRVTDAERGVVDARRQAAQEAKNAAREVADARRSVAAAEADVADARRQSATDIAEANRQVRDAQRNLTDAERNALDVRKALTQAIEDAKDSMAELDVQIKRNEQDQSVAVTAQMEALAALNKLRTNPRATQIELRQAEDAYNEQTVRIEELKVKHKELADDQAKYAKDGVEADDKVIAARKRIAAADQAVSDAREKLAREEAQRRETEYRAQQRISDAQQRVARAQESVARAQEQQRESEIRGQERIAKAQEQVADARRQQARQARDAQYQLAQASQAVTAAQRAQQAAWEKTGVAGGDALSTLNDKMALLSPAQQHFARFLFGLKDDLISLRDAAAEPLLPQLETAITNLLQYLPAVRSFIGDVASALGDIAIKTVDAFGNPVWQRFFGYIRQTAVPSLQQMFEAGENVTQGLISIFLALRPFNGEVGTGLVDLSRDFAEWAERLNKTQGYRDFLAYVQENGPRVVHFLGEVGQLFIDLVKASAPLGSVVLHVLTLLVDVLNSIPTPLLTALVTAIGLVSLAFTALGGVMRASKLKKEITDIFGPRAKTLVDQFAISTGRATDETGKLGKATATMSGIAAAARDKVGGYAGTLASLPGRTRSAITGSDLFTRSMSAVSTAAGAVGGAVGKAGDAARNIGPTLAALSSNAQATAKTGLDRLKLSMLEVVTAANGPGGIAAGAQVAGSKLSDFGASAAVTASNLRGKIASGAGAFASALGGIAKAAGTAATAVGTKLVKAGGSLISQLGGPWGVALAGAGLALGYFTDKSQQQKAKVDTLKAALGELSTTYQDLALTGQQGGAAADEAFRNIVRNNPEMQKAVIQLDALGISFTDMVQAAASGDPSEVLDKLNAEIERNTKLSEAWNNANAVSRGARGENPYAPKVKGLEAIRDAYQQNATALGQANQATEILNVNTERNQAITGAQTATAIGATGAQIDLINSYDRNATSIQVLNGLATMYNNLQSTAQQRAEAMRAAIDDQTSAAVKQSEADESLSQKTIQLREQVLQAKAAHDKNATSLSLSTNTGLRNRDALEQVASSIREMYLQDIAAGKPIADVTKAHNNRINALKEEAKRLGLATSDTDKLIAAYGDVPESVKTQITLDPNSFNAVYTNLQRMQFMQMELRLGRDATRAEQDWQEFQREQRRAIGRAEGGPISGPGTKTSDSVLMWGSDGEWVHKAAAVDYYGEQAMAAINNMQVPREQLIPRRAAGGPVTDEPLPAYAAGGKVKKKQQTWPFKVDVSHTWVPDAEWVRAHTPIPTGDGSWSGVLSPNATVAKMQKWALAQRGKRYLWGAAGPEHYDCSGLVGNLYALATGRKLYRRYMSTSDMGVGRHNMVAGPGKYWTVYLGPGHTASNIAGLHAEAYGGNGVPLAIGHVGTRLSYYGQRLHLPGFAGGGLVDPSKLQTKQDRMISFLRYGWPEPPVGQGFDKLLDSPLVTGQFDTGGMLPPGYSTVVNNTGVPEPVLTAQQWRDISELARHAGRGGNTYQFAFRDTTLDPAELRRIQDREAVLARYDRVR